MPARDVVILGAARTPIGRYGGSLKDIHAAELGSLAAKAALERAGLTPADVDEVLMGHGRPAGVGPNPARQVAHRTGVPNAAPAYTINKACAGGMQAIASGAQSIMLGESDVVLAGGIENMSRVPYLVDAADARWGHKMGNFQFVDAMYRDGFADPLSGLIMGETAEVLARQYGITKEQSDQFALESQRKAEAAQKAGHFTREIAPVTVTEKGKSTEITSDEHPRHGSTIEALRKLPLTFPKVEGHDGIITAGSASGITDGAAALVLASSEFANARGLKPLATIRGWASAGVDPRIMGIGPVPAIARLKDRTGLGIEQFDLVEINEAFAAQVLAVLKDVPIPADKLNVNGGAIALGHPIGCSGARIVVTLLHELQRRGERYGLATLCVSGGMGMAMAIEMLPGSRVPGAGL
ncbi:MAG TPA: acetyl-CoA C-acetyltransferase [Vicinamibacterales bacterium]|nr:acetyl-CoA C-acetyltransferase [Vicinamibacterales bacterium]